MADAPFDPSTAPAPGGDPDPIHWRTLYRHHDPVKVESVWLAIRAMEYPARLADATGVIETDSSEAPGEHPDAAVSPESLHAARSPDDERTATHVEVHGEHIAELSAVIDEIVGEQDELDETIARRAAQRRARQRIAAAAIVVALIGMAIMTRAFG